MARLCGKSIGLGFLLTLAVSYLIGITTPSGATLTEEVLARGGPNVLDLLIAVFAAAAATFAMARPNIAGAIAGVAIATALVPPVCAVGISLANGGVAERLWCIRAVFHQPDRHHCDVEFYLFVIGNHGIAGSTAPSPAGPTGTLESGGVAAGACRTPERDLGRAARRGKKRAIGPPGDEGGHARAVRERVAQDEGVDAHIHCSSAG